MQKVTSSYRRDHAIFMRVQPPEAEANSVPALKYLIFLQVENQEGDTRSFRQIWCRTFVKFGDDLRRVGRREAIQNFLISIACLRSAYPIWRGVSPIIRAAFA